MKSTFKNGGTIDDTAAGLKNGDIDPDAFPPIRVFDVDGDLYSLDNRRLVTFQKAGIDVPYQMVSPQEALSESWKFTTETNGLSILIRGTGEIWTP